jgi:hypothetical protein
MSRTITFTIYGYEKHGQIVYVGQTLTPLKTRHAGHRRGKTTKFDKDLRIDAIFYAPPVVLEQRTVEVSIEDLKECRAWMDKQEKYWILHFETYTTGLNGTTGGQDGFGIASAEAQDKQREISWNEVYMPLFRDSSYGLKGRIWETPLRYAEAGIGLGLILQRVRSGKRFIPPSCLWEMKILGFTIGKSYDETKWEIDYMPIFRENIYGRRGRLWDIPSRYTEKGMNLGALLCGVWAGTKSIPPTFVAEMKILGFDKDRSFKESRWKYDYLPVIDACFYGENRRLWDTPVDYTFEGFKVGLILRNIRATGDINDADLEDLNDMGFCYRRPGFSAEAEEAATYGCDLDESEYYGSERSSKRARLA